MTAELPTSSLFEPTSIEGLPPAGPVKGWCPWKGDEPYSTCVYETKSSLLVGYDFMPLIGLDCCEIALADRGVRVLPTVAEIAAEGEPFHCWATTIQGRLVPYMLEYSVCQAPGPDPDRPQYTQWGPNGTLKTTAGFLADVAENTRDGKPTDAGLRLRLPETDVRALKHHWWAMLGHPYYTKRQYEAIRREAHGVLARLVVEPVQLRLRTIDASELPPGTDVIPRKNCNTTRGKKWLAERRPAELQMLLSAQQ